jgi:hypothetical protein
MKNTLLTSDYSTDEFAIKLASVEEVYKDIHKACNNTHLPGCGSYFMNGQTYDYHIGMYPKQKLLYELAKDANSFLEIGTYMGHSLLIALLANPMMKITCIDIDDTYTAPAVKVLQNHFPLAEIKFIHGDSLTNLNTIDEKFDLIHIDGHHENNYITAEFNMCKTMSNRKDLNVIFDDLDCCQTLITEINLSSQVLMQITPNCDWTNTYLKIKI